jgi:hypothetical protein
MNKLCEMDPTEVSSFIGVMLFGEASKAFGN